MSRWLFDKYMDAVMKEVKIGTGRRRVRFKEEGRERILPGLLNADDLVFCGESKEDMRVTVGRFVEVYRRRDLKVNVGKNKVMVWVGRRNWSMRLVWIRLEHISEFKYLGCIVDESITDEAEWRRKMASGREAAGAIK